MDGILIIDKPAGQTSHDVVARVRRILKTKRVGHTGTLDPFATGVLVVMVGRATRLAQFLDKDVKAYEAEVQFGVETDTGDATGRRKAEGGRRSEEIVEKVASADWETVLSKFRGVIMQTPPMYSAKKVRGEKMYELARRGEVVERKAVAVTIHELEILPDESLPASALRIHVACSAGTYVRTLAEDIGRHIGTGAHLINLRRTAAGKFDLSQSTTLEDLDASSAPEKKLLPIDLAVSHLPGITLEGNRIDKTKSGLATRVESADLADGQYVRMIGNGNGLLAIGVYDEQERSVRPKVVLI